MLELDAIGIKQLKERVTDPEVLAYIDILEAQNDRLQSHHTSCKEEIGQTLELAQRWRIQAWVVEKLARWLNNLNPWWYPSDLSKEIKIHTDRLMDKWRRRENWMADEEETWEATIGRPSSEDAHAK